ncbi:hypothetical protein [Acinetobacter brisouii]|uniref:hypothetical protein n=1 Tax=Acinetobacter brisouii TaxID=396323 RepID=UPI0035B4C496
MIFLSMPSVNELLEKRQKTGALLHKCLVETSQKTHLRGLFEGDKQGIVNAAHKQRAA